MNICALDIDGVLNTYPQCWIDFINSHSGTQFTTLYEAKDTLVYSKYKSLKRDYRKVEGIRLPVKPGAVKFSHILRDNGYKIIIITSRPFDEFLELKMDTKDWLDNNNICYDDLLHSKRKHLEILSQYPETRFVVEDNRNYSLQIAKFGYRVYLMNNMYNQGEVPSNVTRIEDFEDIYKNENFKW